MAEEMEPPPLFGRTDLEYDAEEDDDLFASAVQVNNRVIGEKQLKHFC